MLLFDRYGRKCTFLLISILELTGWATISTASSTNKTWMFSQVIFGRLLTGIAYGLSIGPGAVYAAEVSHASIRGRAVSLITVIYTFGLLLVYLLGYFMPVSIPSS